MGDLAAGSDRRYFASVSGNAGARLPFRLIACRERRAGKSDRQSHTCIDESQSPFPLRAAGARPCRWLRDESSLARHQPFTRGCC